jgi:hypothetical protein
VVVVAPRQYAGRLRARYLVRRRFFEGTIHFSPDSSKLGLWMTALLPAKAGSAGRPSVSELWVLPIHEGMRFSCLRRWPTRRIMRRHSAGCPTAVTSLSAIPYPRPGFTCGSPTPTARIHG